MAETNTPAPANFFPVVLLGAIVIGIGQLGYTSLLPALIDIKKEFGVDHSAGALLIAIFVLGMAIATLLVGLIASLFNEADLICLGLIFFSIANIAGAFSTEFYELLLSRFFAGGGAGCLAFLVRTVYQSKFQGDDLAKAFSWYNIFFAAFPLLGPFIGGVIAYSYGWRGVLYGLTVIGLLCAGGVFLAREWFCSNDRTKGGVHTTIRIWLSFTRNRFFLCSASIYILGYVFYQQMLTSSPYIIIETLNVSSLKYSYLMMLLGAGDILGSLLSIYLVNILDRKKALFIGISMTGISFIPLIMDLGSSLTAVVIFLFILFAANSLVVANSLAIALEAVNIVTPAVSSAVGFTQMLVSSLWIKSIALLFGIGLSVLSICGVAITLLMFMLLSVKNKTS